jgi:hypothetical protein
VPTLPTVKAADKSDDEKNRDFLLKDLGVSRAILDYPRYGMQASDVWPLIVVVARWNEHKKLKQLVQRLPAPLQQPWKQSIGLARDLVAQFGLAFDPKDAKAADAVDKKATSLTNQILERLTFDVFDTTKLQAAIAAMEHGMHGGGHGGHGHSHGGKPCTGHGNHGGQGGHGHSHGGAQQQHQQHGHSHNGKPCSGHGNHGAQGGHGGHSHAQASHGGGHGHSHGGKPCAGHGPHAGTKQLQQQPQQQTGELQSSCAFCGSRPSVQPGQKVVKLLTCSRCKKASYCSAAHQKAHWKKHKKVCKAA